MSELNYIFEDDGVSVEVDGKRIEASTIDELEIQVLADREEKIKASATHITTPNGLRGQILGRNQDVWGETVTVRFENGRIASFHTAAASDLAYEGEEARKEGVSVKSLEARLNEEVDGTLASLESRVMELENIRREATDLIHKEKSDSEREKLDNIVVTAKFEASEIEDAIAHIESTESYEPPVPFKMQAAEQETLGGHDGGWLDSTVGEMIREAESRDFDQMMAEGPEMFIADLETPALGDAGVVRQMASSFVRSKTAGVDPEAAQEFEKSFLARVEGIRRAELIVRKETMAKEASTSAEDYDGPDDALFI